MPGHGKTEKHSSLWNLITYIRDEDEQTKKFLKQPLIFLLGFSFQMKY